MSRSPVVEQLQPQTQMEAARARFVLAAIFFSRLVINLQFRMVYPYLPAISRGLGVPLATATLLVTARSLAGFTSPLYGRLADRYGRRALMLAGLTAVVVGATAVGFAKGMALAVFGFTVMGFARACYDPAAQAYIGDWVPYERRGRAMGLIELPWSTSWLIGVPAAGLLIQRWDWHAPFLVASVLGVAGLLLSLRMPSMATRRERDLESASGEPQPAASDTIAHQKRLLSRPVLVGLGISGLAALANSNFFLISGAWLEQDFGLATGALGLVFGITGLAELAAELLSAGVLDRVGKRRGLIFGLLLNGLAYLLLPRLSFALIPALIGAALVIFTSEFTIVSVLSPLSELAPSLRGTVMAINSALLAGGVTLSSLIAPRLWASGGLTLSTTASAIAVALALVLAFRLSRHS